MPGSKSLAGRGFGAERGLLPRNPFCVWTQTPTPCRYEVRDGVLRLKPTLTEHIMEELYTAGEDRVRPPPSQRCLLLFFLNINIHCHRVTVILGLFKHMFSKSVYQRIPWHADGIACAGLRAVGSS